MKAVQISRYGGPEVLEYKDIAKPSITEGQVLVRVRATSVNPIDWKIRSGELKLFVRKDLPFILGCDIAGEIAEVGKGSRFSVGDPVFASLPGDTGAYAEYVPILETLVARKPKNMTFEEAASVPATAETALQGLREMGGLVAGQNVLVNGASGGVGIFAVQIAKALGASVTGVCSSANVALVEGLGADRVLDYKKTDIFAPTDKPYDVVLDCVGNHDFGPFRAIMSPRSTFVTTSPKSWPGMFARQTFLNPFTSKKAKLMILAHTPGSLQWIADQIESGKIRTIIDRTFPLSEVAAAHEYSATGRAKGKLVMTIGD